MEISNNNILIINFFMFCFLIWYINKKTSNIENFDTTSDSIKQAVKDLYLADIDAIRNLSAVATALSAGGYTIPGNITTGDGRSLNLGNYGGDLTDDNGRLAMGDKITLNYKNDKSRANLQFTGSSLDFNFNQNQNNAKYNFNGNLNVSGDTTIKGTTMTGRKTIIGNSSNGVNSTISDSAHDPNTLCIVGQDTGSGRRIHLWDDVVVDRNLQVNGSETIGGNLQVNGNVNINGSLTVNGRLIALSDFQLNGAYPWYFFSGSDGLRVSPNYTDSNRFYYGRGVGQRNI